VKVVGPASGLPGQPVFNQPKPSPDPTDSKTRLRTRAFNEANLADVPSFLFHLGDVVYYFGEATCYYDQFFARYRDYPAPSLAAPGLAA
jgi:hypothetical protein